MYSMSLYVSHTCIRNPFGNVFVFTFRRQKGLKLYKLYYQQQYEKKKFKVCVLQNLSL